MRGKRVATDTAKTDESIRTGLSAERLKAAVLENLAYVRPAASGRLP